MIALFDTSTLIFLLKPDAPAPRLPGSDDRVSNCSARINYLLSELQRARATIVVPTPVLAEILVLADQAGPDWLRILTTSRHFRSSPFDAITAVECSVMAKSRMGAGRISRTEKAKAKFDEQIVAIAKVERAEVIYSDDADIRRLAGDEIKVVGMADLPLPPTDRQGRLDLEPSVPDEDQPDPEVD